MTSFITNVSKFKFNFVRIVDWKIKHGTKSVESNCELSTTS